MSKAKILGKILKYFRLIDAYWFSYRIPESRKGVEHHLISASLVAKNVDASSSLFSHTHDKNNLDWGQKRAGPQHCRSSYFSRPSGLSCGPTKSEDVYLQALGSAHLGP